MKIREENRDTTCPARLPAGHHEPFDRLLAAHGDRSPRSPSRNAVIPKRALDRARSKFTVSGMNAEPDGSSNPSPPLPATAGELLPLVYEELRRLAARRMAEQKPGQTLQATALVHEAVSWILSNDATATRCLT